MSDKKEDNKPGKKLPDKYINPFVPKRLIILPPGVNVDEDEKPKKSDGGVYELLAFLG